MPKLQAGAQTSQVSERGLFVLGPLLTRLIAYFESQSSPWRTAFQARAIPVPHPIPARYLERVNYFRAFPHSLTFATTCAKT